MATGGEIAHLLNEQAENFSIHVLREKPTYRSSSEIRFHANHSIRVIISGAKRGKWTNYADSLHGDMIDLYMARTGASRGEAFSYAKNWLGLSDGPTEIVSIPLPTPIKDDDGEQKRLRVAQTIWRQSGPLNDDAKTYLLNRGIKKIESEWIRSRILSKKDLVAMRLNPDLAKDPVVSIVFGATNSQGDLRAIQQILTIKGKKATCFDVPKRSNGLLKGSAVRLDRAQNKVILAEGPETALSLRECFNMPTWVSLGTSNYTNIEFTNTITEIMIAVDIDENGAGIISALKAAAHFDRLGKTTVLLFPGDPSYPQKKDFNDLHQELGTESVIHHTKMIRTKQPFQAKNRLVLTMNPLDALAIWENTGSTVKVTRVGDNLAINPHLHFEEQFKEIVLVTVEKIPHLDQWKQRNPDTVVKIIPLPPKAYYIAWKSGQSVEGWISGEKLPTPCLFHGQEKLPQEGDVVLCQTRAAADVVPSPRIGLAFDIRQPIDHYPWHILRGRKVILAPSHCEHGRKAAAYAASYLQEAGANPFILDWPTSIQPKKDGKGIIPRESNLPLHYDLASAIKEGWNGEMMDKLFEHVFPLIV